MPDRNTTSSKQRLPTDAAGAVTAAAQQRLRVSPYHALHQVRCELKDDVMILRGRVPSFYFKQLAQEVVRKVDGAREIINELAVEDRSQSAADDQANGKSHVRSTERQRQGTTEATHGRTDTYCG